MAWRRTSDRPWTSYQIRKIAGCACAGNAGNVFPRCRFQRKPLVSDPGMHHGTCVTHVSWCMSGSLTCGDGENVPGIPSACAPAILRIWQEAHCLNQWCSRSMAPYVITKQQWLNEQVYSSNRLYYRIHIFCIQSQGKEFLIIRQHCKVNDPYSTYMPYNYMHDECF